MHNTIVVACTAALLSFLTQSAAHSIPTKWEIVDASMSDLLNSGWQLLGVSYNRVAVRNSISPGGLDAETYVFSLTKNGKYIVCTTDNPNAPVAKSTGCRKIS
jgi:hypothetical protein